MENKQRNSLKEIKLEEDKLEIPISKVMRWRTLVGSLAVLDFKLVFSSPPALPWRWPGDRTPGQADCSLHVLLP